MVNKDYFKSLKQLKKENDLLNKRIEELNKSINNIKRDTDYDIRRYARNLNNRRMVLSAMYNLSQETELKIRNKYKNLYK